MGPLGYIEVRSKGLTLAARNLRAESDRLRAELARRVHPGDEVFLFLPWGLRFRF